MRVWIYADLLKALRMPECKKILTVIFLASVYDVLRWSKKTYLLDTVPFEMVGARIILKGFPASRSFSGRF